MTHFKMPNIKSNFAVEYVNKIVRRILNIFEFWWYMKFILFTASICKNYIPKNYHSLKTLLFIIITTTVETSYDCIKYNICACQ